MSCDRAAARSSRRRLGPDRGLRRRFWWLVLLKAVAIVVLLLGLTLFNIVFERKVVARMQHRVGPNRTGPWGTLQSLADGMKLIFKETITPKGVDRVVYVLAPVIAAIPAFLIFAVIPMGPEVSIFGETTMLQLTDMSVAVLFVLAVASVGVYGIVLGRVGERFDLPAARWQSGRRPR